ncbi:hypothetical protein [Cytophaga sp. FL35]|uniref:hypothetical protein n=1 Tax=Cytophaga sp. FL35 TaxID=1904456 RepID=UPI001653BD9C|nr:hypothetical protein [Cytophaga sp. FL35]MBC7000619.1 hypothetical protein [Cytophaga sp. FL35]
MGRPLFRDMKPRHTFQVDKKGKPRKIQDIPKQDFLICSDCEKQIEISETYFARKLKSINDYSNRKDKFEISKIGPNEILYCIDLNPLLFKLFCFSIIWRLSMTSNPLFKNFKLPNEVEAEIGLFLSTNLFPTHKELLENLNLIEKYPQYHLMAYKPKTGSRKFTGILTAFQMSEDHYGIFTSDMILFFYLNENKMDSQARLISNKDHGFIKFILADAVQWRNISSAVVNHRLLNNSI